MKGDIMAAARVTENPKEIRFEIRLTENENEKLIYCSEVYRLTKTGVFIQGLNNLFDDADEEKERQEIQLSVEEAEHERENEVYKKAYEKTYEKCYQEIYAELILDSNYMPSEARDTAADAAKDTAADAAKLAVKDFWSS